MSDQDEQDKTPPSKLTSKVPLMKETVRVTLKASDAPPAAPASTVGGQKPPSPTRAPAPAKPPTPGGDAPAQRSSARINLPKKATSPQSLTPDDQKSSSEAPTSQPTPPPSKPAAPAPPSPSGGPPTSSPPKATAPIQKTPPAAKPAPTIQLKTAGGDKKPGGPAPTIRLATSKAPVGAQSSAPTKSGTQPALPGAAKSTSSALPGALPSAKPAPTQPLKTAGPNTASLPKATVQLTPPTKPLTAPGQATGQPQQTFKVAGGYQQPPEPTVVKILAGVGLAAALALVTFQCLQSNIWISVEDNSRQGEWGQLFE